MNQHSAKWTDERVDQLKALWGQGLSCRDIAGEMGGGVTRNAIIGKATRIGLKGNTKPANPRKQKRRSPTPRHGGGLTNGHVPRIMGLSETEPLPPVDVIDLEIPIGQRRSLATLNNWTCRWPCDSGADLFYCGGAADLIAGFSYCVAHTLRARR